MELPMHDLVIIYFIILIFVCSLQSSEIKRKRGEALLGNNIP